MCSLPHLSPTRLLHVICIDQVEVKVGRLQFIWHMHEMTFQARVGRHVNLLLTWSLYRDFATEGILATVLIEECHSPRSSERSAIDSMSNTDGTKHDI